MRRLDILLLLLILLLAGVLRLGWPGVTEFKADEARLLALALDTAAGQFALRGISSSVGFPNFPASVWIYALPLLIWPHVYAATLFTGLLNTLAVAACYGFVRRYWGVGAALTAALLFAVSPWAVIFSRKIWAQNLLPLFVMGWAIGAALALVEKRPRFIWLHLVCLALAVQIHLAAVALVPATLLLLLIFRRRVVWRHVIIGAALAAVTVLPFALYLGRAWQADGGLPTLAGATRSAVTLDSLRFTTMLNLGANIHSLAGPEAFTAYLARVPDLTLVYVIWGALILLGVVVLAADAWRRRQTPRAQAGVIVLLWLFVPPLFFLWHTTPVFIHYFIATLPAAYIAAGAGVARLPSLLRPRAQPIARSALALALLTTAALQLYAFATLLNFVATTDTPGGFGTPLAFKLEAVATAERLLTETAAGEILVAGPGEAPRVDEVPAEYDVLLRGTPHRFVDVRSAALFPAQAAVVLVDGRARGPLWTGDLYREAAIAREAIALRPGEGSFEVLALPPQAKPAPDVPVEPLLLANWVNLLGHDEPQRLDEATAVWQIHWRTGDNPDPANYHFFNHLVNGAGERIGQTDAAAFTPQQWRAGDALISRFLLPWPAGAQPPLTVRVGMYRFPSLESVPLLDEAANPYADAAEWPVQP